MTTKPVLLLLGSGPGIGLSVCARFRSGGYLVCAVSRAPPPASAASAADLFLAADLSDPSQVARIFAECERGLGAPPRVVVYNAYALNPAPLHHPLAVGPDALAASLAVNAVSAYAAAAQAVAGWARLLDPQDRAPAPAPAACTFIYTGNMQNAQCYPATADLGMGKNAAAYFVECAASAPAYAGRPYRFYYADQRTPDGRSVMAAVDGPAHADFYWSLAAEPGHGGAGQRPWCQTFVAGTGYVRMQDVRDREVVPFEFPHLKGGLEGT